MGLESIWMIVVVCVAQTFAQIGTLDYRGRSAGIGTRRRLGSPSGLGSLGLSRTSGLGSLSGLGLSRTSGLGSLSGLGLSRTSGLGSPSGLGLSRTGGLSSGFGLSGIGHSDPDPSIHRLPLIGGPSRSRPLSTIAGRGRGHRRIGSGLAGQLGLSREQFERLRTRALSVLGTTIYGHLIRPGMYNFEIHGGAGGGARFEDGLNAQGWDGNPATRGRYRDPWSSPMHGRPFSMLPQNFNGDFSSVQHLFRPPGRA